MTAKTKVGKTFPGLVKYAMQECKEARVLGAEGVRSNSVAHMAADFDFQRDKRPRLGNAVLHVAISLPKEETEGKTREQVGEMLRQSAAAWRKEMKIENTQWALIQHFDREHSHAHLIITGLITMARRFPTSSLASAVEKLPRKWSVSWG